MQHGATGAEDAYNRLIRATNWATKLPQLETYPGQGIKPRGYEPLPAGVPYSLPSVSNALAIETTSNGDTGYQSVRPSGMSAFNFVRTMVGSYGSGVFCENYSNAGAYIVAGSGGHGHPDTVDAYGFDFTTGAWFSLLNSNGAPRDDSGFNGTTATGSPWYEVVGYTEVPAPPHPYSHVVYVPPANGGGTKGSVMHAARAAVTTGASNTGVAHAFQLNTRTWSRRSTNGVSVDVEGRSIMDPVTSRVYVVVHTYHTKTALEYFDTSSVGAAQSVGSFTAPPDYGTDGCAPYPGLALDPVRRLLVRTLQRKLRAIDLNNINAGWQAITLTNATTLPDVPMGQTEPVWHPTREAFYWMPASGGSTLYKITPPATNPFSNAWVVTSQTIGGDTLHPHGGTGVNGDGVGAYKSLMYVPYVDRLAWIAGGHIDGTVYPVTLINPT